jgi:cellulose synthase/poly-beta-1,6-N-acetylglucosamine synthase-like glycosyltransferase
LLFALHGVLAAVCLGWVVILLASLPSFLRRRLLEPLARPPESWPKVSVIVTALDEETSIEAALRTLLAATYPQLEIVAVNDRSRDRTGAIIDALAREEPRLKPVHIQELPAGWLGKVHAMAQGAKVATGQWLLFTDADVHFEHQVLERAVAVAVDEHLDHLTLWPKMIGRSLLMRTALVAFGATLILLLRPHRVGRPGSKAIVGIGAFNLVRRAALDQSPGLEWLKMEVVDDSGLAKLIVDSGGKSAYRSAGDSLWLEWYPSTAALIRGLEKNTYAAFSHFRISVFVRKALLACLLLAGPYVAVWGPTPWWLKAGGCVVFGTWVAMAWLTSRIMGFGPLPAVLAPWVGAAVLLVASCRSTLLCWRQGGIYWRGTFYPVAELRAGARLKL